MDMHCQFRAALEIDVGDMEQCVHNLYAFCEIIFFQEIFRDY